MPHEGSSAESAAVALTNMRVVLVEPQHPGNIGAVARAMKNMAFTQLALVNPADHLATEARMMAMHARDVLQNARVCTTLTEAIEDAGFIVGTTRRLGKARQALLTPRAMAPKLIELAHSNPVAIVFGREVSGLTNDELGRCHELITIPSHPEFGSLNLAQAVMVAAYEIFLACSQPPPSENPPRASSREAELALSMFQSALLEIGFLPPENPEARFVEWRELFGRAGLTPREAKILLALGRRVKNVGEISKRAKDV